MSHSNHVEAVNARVPLRELPSSVEEVSIKTALPRTAKPSVVDLTGTVRLFPSTPLSKLASTVSASASSPLGEVPAFRIQNASARSRVGVKVSLKEREKLSPLVERLALLLEQGGDGLGTIKPSLNLVVMVKPDGTRESVDVSTLDPEAQEVFREIKTYYLAQHGGAQAHRLAFQGESKANINGFQPFHTRVTTDASAKKFMKSRFEMITKGMTEEMKVRVKERIELAEIVVAKKTKAYEGLITKIKKELEQASNSQAKKLRKDLVEATKKYNQLKALDPHALYWLSAYYPQDPGSEKQAMRQANALYSAAFKVTQNERYARELATILIPGRESYFYYCSQHHIQMRNTKPMEEILREVVRMETEGSYSLDARKITAPYQSDFAKKEIKKVEKRTQRQASKIIKTVAPVKAQMERRSHLSSVFLDAKAGEYEALAGELSLEREKNVERQEELKQEIQTLRAEAFRRYPAIPDTTTTPELITQLERENQTNLIHLDDLKTPLEVAYQEWEGLRKMELNILKLREKAETLRTVGLDQEEQEERKTLRAVELRTREIHSRLEAMERRRAQRFQEFLPYFHTSTRRQKEALSLLKQDLKRRGHSKEEVQRCMKLILDSQVRSVLKQMRGFKKSTDAHSVATSAVQQFNIPANAAGVGADGDPLDLGTLSPQVSSRVYDLEKQNVERAKEFLFRKVKKRLPPEPPVQSDPSSVFHSRIGLPDGGGSPPGLTRVHTSLDDKYQGRYTGYESDA